MIHNSRQIYAQKALSQIPRLLTLQDRNPFSPTYGCMHRDFWLYKTSDFADAVRQFGVHALAIVYKEQIPGNRFYRQPKIKDWAIAGMLYWTSLQHSDGSFDEFYPYERGWVGPSAFTTYSVIETLNLLKPEMSQQDVDRIQKAIRKAAYFIAAGESEEDHLANHHAMACLAVWKAYKLLGDPELRDGFERVFDRFKTYHNSREGWSREYDGVDPGYLSATVSFLGKIYKTHRDPRIFEILKQSVEFCSYFVYPNGYYAGSTGSRNTLHFYCHGFEVLGSEIPLAASIAERMLQALGEEKLVPPEIMSDRYVFYRVPEFLQAYLDYTERPGNLPSLPYEREGTHYFPASRIFISSRGKHYVVANLAKGGVTKIFDRQTGELLLNDCGFLGTLEDGRVVTSQWIDPSYRCTADENGWTVEGCFNVVPSHKLFTPLKGFIFRGILVTLGWIPAFSHRLKGLIRRTLMLGTRPVSIQFRRVFRMVEEPVLEDEIRIVGREKLKALAVGDEFFVRYVPQSRFFQFQELDCRATQLSQEQIQRLNSGQTLKLEHKIGKGAFREQSRNEVFRT